MKRSLSTMLKNKIFQRFLNLFSITTKCEIIIKIILKVFNIVVFK